MMSRADFISQLNRLRRRGLLVWYGGGGVALAFDSLILFEVFRRFPLRERNPAALSAYLAGFVITAIPPVALWIAFRYGVARHAPACPACRARATWINRAEILSSGQCPKCGAEFVQPDA